jgi:hypothetical protein
MFLKRVSYPAMGLMLCFVVTGCSRESKQQQPVTTAADSKTSTAPASAAAAAEQKQALVRVIDAVPSKPALDVAAKDADVFKNVSYKTVTPYREIPSDAGKFIVKPAGETPTQPLAENSESISSGRHYTVVVFPDKDHADKVYVKAFSDDQEPSTTGRARVRVINAAVDADKIAVYTRGEKDSLFSGVGFQDAASYKEVGPGEVTLEIRSERSGVTKEVADATTARVGKTEPNRPGEKMIATEHVTLDSGKTYTIVLAGPHQNKHDVIVVEDTVPQQQPARTE